MWIEDIKGRRQRKLPNGKTLTVSCNKGVIEVEEIDEDYNKSVTDKLTDMFRNIGMSYKTL